jgi:hypothetical protein
VSCWRISQLDQIRNAAVLYLRWNPLSERVFFVAPRSRTKKMRTLLSAIRVRPALPPSGALALLTGVQMQVRPTIFLSGVSHEFGSFRDAVENEIEMKGCFAENQPGFAPDYRTVEEMLRRRLHDSDGVVHIVGFRFGAEPKQRPDDTPR